MPVTRTTRALLWAAITALVFAAEPFIADQLKSPFLGVIGDHVWVPGALASSIFFREGSHTGGGSSLFVPVAGLLNFVFYFLLVLGVVLFVTRMRARKNQP
jgi:hypothetical protein